MLNVFLVSCLAVYLNKQKRNTMTYQVAKEISEGNTETLYATFATLVKMAQESGLSLPEAKREAKAMLNCLANAWEKTQANFQN